MRKQRTALLAFLLLLTVFFGACEQPQAAQPEKGPAGIHSVAWKECYLIEIPSGRSVRTYCTLIGNANQLVFNYFGQMDADISLGAVSYQEIEEVGWVAYNDSLMLIMPSVRNINDAKEGCRLVAFRSSSMTVEQARSYLTWL